MNGITYYALIGLIQAGPGEVMRNRATLGRALGVSRARAGQLLKRAKAEGYIHRDFLPDRPQMVRSRITL